MSDDPCCAEAIAITQIVADVTATECVDCGKHCHIKLAWDNDDKPIRSNGRWRCADCYRRRKETARG